nr:afadin-like [Lytechinus pictus]
MDPRSREEDRMRLKQAIQDWNATRMDLFEISDPDMNLEFHGVMRFFFQDATDGSSNSKCIRVSSTASTRDVVNTLIEKFHPDMRMLSIPDYALFELQRDQG